MRFEDWMNKVEDLVVASCGISTADLPDQPYRDWFDDKVSIRRAAKRVIRSAIESY